MRLCATLLLSLLSLTTLAALEIGDQAPSLDGVDWIKGEAPDFGKQITVVEFWATWCPPCLKSIPHLTKLQQKYGDQVAIVGLSREKETAKVKAFVQKQGDQMDYAVGLWSQGDAYMAGIGGIPHAFVLDKGGKLLWHGHPMQMDQVLSQAVAGTLDPKQLQKVMAKEAALQESFKTNDLSRIASAAQDLLALEPAHELGVQVLTAIAKERNDAQAYRAVFEAIEVESLSADQATGLVRQALAVEEAYVYRQPDLALGFAKRAIAVAPDDADALAAMADVRYALGDIEAAIASIKKAIAAGGDFADSLAYFEKLETITP